MSHNHLSTLPDELCYATHLKVLKVQSNRIAHLPEHMGRLSHLAVLWIGNNEIQRYGVMLLSHLPCSIDLTWLALRQAAVVVPQAIVAGDG